MTKHENNIIPSKYFWLKIKSDFSKQKEIKDLRNIAGGDTFTIIYLKMVIGSLKNDEKLFYPYSRDDFAEEIAIDIDESAENVTMAIIYLESKNMIERVESYEHFSDANYKFNNCNNTECSSSTDLTSDDKGREIDNTPYKSIVDYLNKKAKTNYKVSTAKTKSLIKSRFKEGFSEKDFKDVIDKKVSEWKGTDMARYLRPETIFGSKFESYLNAPSSVNPTTLINRNGITPGKLEGFNW